MRKAVFLDRDGTIAYDAVHCGRPEDLRLIPGAAQAVRLLNDAGFVVAVVTNQSAVARGYVTEAALEAIHGKMRADLALGEASVDAVYFCPHHPSDGCDCRKPEPGLLLRAAREMDIDLSRSFMVGNRAHDIEAAAQAGCRPVLVADEAAPEERAAQPPEYEAADIYDAARWIVQEARHAD